MLLLGGKPIREPVFSYGPFVMNTKQEIIEAIDDFQAGKMGSIPPRKSGLKSAVPAEPRGGAARQRSVILS